MCMCVGVKNRIVTCEKCMFSCEKGYKWIGVLGSPKIYYLEDREGLSDHLKQMIKRFENKKKIRIIRAAVWSLKNFH